MSQGPEARTGAQADEVCPVCQWPDEGAEVCGVCGWQLVGEYLLGPVTPAAEREFAARLTDARRHFDLRAAVRAAGPAGERDRDQLDRLVGLIRGGARPDRRTIEQVEEEVDAVDRPVAETSAGIGFALTRLVTGQSEAIAFVEVGRDAIAVQTLIRGAMGVPTRLVGDRLSWTDCLPLLPADDDLRHLRMAGDIGRVTGVPGSYSRQPSIDLGTDRSAPAALLALVHEAIEPALDRLMAAASAAVAASRASTQPGAANSLSGQAAHRVDTVLVRRTYRWPVLDAVGAQVRAFLRPVAEIVVRTGEEDLIGVVKRVNSQAPLRYGYDLVLAAVDSSTRVVTIKPHRLFAPGAAAVPGLNPVNVAVNAVPGHTADRVLLPVVARRTANDDYQDLGTLAASRPLVTMKEFDATVPGHVDLTIRLAGPAHLEIADAQRRVRAPVAMPEWPDLLAGLPARLPTEEELTPRPLDLVLLVELGGGTGTVHRRVAMARSVIDELDAVPGQVRVAVVGYRDHFGNHHIDAIGHQDQADEALLVGGKLTSPDGALSMFKKTRQWQAVPIGDIHAAPIEDALQSIVTDPGWKWEPTARHVLLTIGGRPPHPVKVSPDGDPVQPCPHRWSWQDSLRRLRGQQSVECFAVLDGEVTSEGYAERAWQQLGERFRYDAAGVTAERVVRDIANLEQAPSAKLCLATRAAAGSSQPLLQEAVGQEANR